MAAADGREETYSATGNHPFWIENHGDETGWTAAEDLRAGDALRLADGSAASVISLTETGTNEPVYNMDVDGWHTYHVGILGTWVHNMNCLNRFEQRQLDQILKLSGFGGPQSTRNALTLREFSRVAENFVGPESITIINTQGVTVLRSADGLRQVRFPVFKPQVHPVTKQPFNSSDIVGNFEARTTNRGAFGSNVHVGLKP